MSEMLASLRRAAIPMTAGRAADAILDDIGDASIVLLGEATHGTHEFYRIRAELCQRLIQEKGFDAIAVEADWPDALCVHRFIRGSEQSQGSADPPRALDTFERFPRWMWRNAEIAELVRWLRDFNHRQQDSQAQVGFFGLDLYSLRRSMNAVVAYLDKVDPEAARGARARYGCFDHLAEDPQRYGYATTFGLRSDCEDAVVEQLLQLAERETHLLEQNDADEAFFAQQNGRVAASAEAYYRAMFRGRNASWNLRDTHMVDTLSALHAHLSARKGRPARLAVWAHNSHIGDARHTEMGEDGQINLGQLVRERWSEKAYLLGFTTHAGVVCAASDWDSPVERKNIVPSLPESVERVMHDVGLPHFFLPLRALRGMPEVKLAGKLERAIGVIYLPQSERVSHYFRADPVQQFDGIVHVDVSTAVTPLDDLSHVGEEQAPETFPSGM